MKIIIVNGFLGSGKTTFIKTFIHQGTLRSPIIVNEFGKSNYDQERLAQDGNQVTLINHGSIFCTCKAVEFVAVLAQMMIADESEILVESSGFADPSGMDSLIVQALNNSGKSSVEVCALSIVDPLTFRKLVGSMAILRRQVEIADTILISKCDLVDEESIQTLTQTLKIMNSKATIFKGSNGYAESLKFQTHTLTKDSVGKLVSKKDAHNSELSVEVDPWGDEEKLKEFLSEIEPHLFRLKGSLQIGRDHYRVELASGRTMMESVPHSTGILTLLYSTHHSSQKELLDILYKYQPKSSEKRL